MGIYLLFSKKNTQKDLRNEIIVPIEKNLWLDYINNHKDFTWYVDTSLGQLDKNHPTHPLDPQLHYVRAYYDLDKKKGYSNIVVEFPLQHCNYVTFQYPRITAKILNMMWDMAQGMDCHLVKGRTIINEEKFKKLKEKFTK